MVIGPAMRLLGKPAYPDGIRVTEDLCEVKLQALLLHTASCIVASYCALLSDDMSRACIMREASSIYNGFEDLGHFGRSPILADPALAYMIRGIRRT
ncbi:hypothetical protein J437_LFUL008136 [Ladona fulva]|uniref:Uncharacterized protein n=1 Tax=Ladona fulva TaxID=123851 RepID=A0A8K0NUV1_LADFU|nr:hypothetical protein J437_LFUL008136 [Ladona fulva]